MWMQCFNISLNITAPAAAAAPAAKEEKKEEKKKEESEEEDDDMGFGMVLQNLDLYVFLTVFLLQVCLTKGIEIHFCIVSSHGPIVFVQIHQEFHKSVISVLGGLKAF
jgi:hypothetical protein